MAVLRIVTDVSADDLSKAYAFYRDLLGLEVVMDQGWIVTFASSSNCVPQISIAVEGGSGTRVPDISIEVDDVDGVYQRAKAAGYDILYDMTDEPWGVRRFYVSDPYGKVINILSHLE